MKLLALEGLAPGTELVLGPAPLIFGRSSSCSVVLDDDDVSRQHCQIRPSGAGYVLEDLGSENGTVVNGQQIGQPVVLQPGDLVVIGRALFELRDEPPPASLGGHARPATPAAPAAAPVERASSTADRLPALASTASAAWRAALAGQRLEGQLAALVERLSWLESTAGHLSDALRRAERVGGEPEARRLLAVCRSVATAENAEQRAERLGLEVPALRQIVSAALDLFAALPT